MVRRNYFYPQLIGLLGFVVIAPIAQDYDLFDDRVIGALATIILLIAGAVSLRGQGMRSIAAVTLAGLGTASAGAVLFLDHKLLLVLMALTTVAFVSFSGVYAIRDVMQRGLIGGNELVGAVCVYINIAVFWAILYYLLEQLDPGSFRDLVAPEPELLEFVYISFVTLTTLGYGDIVPVSGAVRTLAYTQAGVGQFYIAVLVAGLVGTRLARVTSDAPEHQRGNGETP
ncbi:MAG: ion channel [Pseudomonadales bacterium]